jgi:hypothetical protein
MMKISMTQRDELFAAGYAARKAERPRATATCITFNGILKDFAGFDVKTFQALCLEWYEGFDACTDEIIADMFEGDEYFLAKVVSSKQNREARLARLGE